MAIAVTRRLLVRIAGSALMLAGQLQGQTGLLIASLVMDSAGVGALLLSSLGFIGMAYVNHLYPTFYLSNHQLLLQ